MKKNAWFFWQTRVFFTDSLHFSKVCDSKLAYRPVSVCSMYTPVSKYPLGRSFMQMDRLRRVLVNSSYPLSLVDRIFENKLDKYIYIYIYVNVYIYICSLLMLLWFKKQHLINRWIVLVVQLQKRHSPPQENCQGKRSSPSTGPKYKLHNLLQAL